MTALLVAHGQPSDPGPAARALDALAAKVASHLPGREVRAATLAEPGALARAVAGPPGTVLPLFMACGWFSETHLPTRLAQAGGAAWHILPPLGCTPEVQDLTVTLAAEAAAEGATALILAAHGSGRSPMPAAVTRLVASRVSRETAIARAEAAFLEQAPRLSDIAGSFPETTVCLPWFAAEGGHVAEDLPELLAEGGFRGRILPPVGLDPRLPALIARLLARQM
ncbi:CbiX/SirB N-terminal domain-containing protein [Neotabrizicola shimadae]|uniref:Cobalamin biosynthesis protein CbiX n=1 Tax=Neotabrizicola shimadae TaxID=2807096 RepID=A0A8G0ZXL0_9RHOB|nr:CbiX/SirB N-terminal domain-containing protein [Neotabrizicola shimadae]QYZ70583.1 cobalamin biosynthesis protein CbiX [Neotabrizicola shimadae]